MNILALESSTTSAKALLFSSETGIVQTVTREYPQEHNENGVQDARAVFELTAELGRGLAANYPVDMVTLGGTWHNLLFLDAQGRPASPGYSWGYSGAAQAAGRLRQDKDFVDWYYHATGCMVHAIYPSFKLLHFKEQGQSLADVFISSQGGYNFLRLTGLRVTTPSMMSGSGLLDIHTKQYCTRILDYIGIREEQLDKLAGPLETFPLSQDGAALLGIAAGTPVLPTNPDGALNQVGIGELEQGTMTFSVGTSAALRLSAPQPLLPEDPSIWCYLSPFSWLSGAATSGACNCIDWAKNRFFPDKSYDDIEISAVDQEKLPVFLPFLYGERCPGWSDGRRGGFYDLEPFHTPEDLYVSVMEGVLFNLLQCYEVLCQYNGEPKCIHLSGGILNSSIWIQMCSDIFQRELICSNQKQASLIGGAFLGLAAAGQPERIRAFVEQDNKSIRPDPQRAELFRARYQRYLSWYEKTGR